MRRIHAFELHDLRHCPVLVRETIQESLGNALRWGRLYHHAAPAFADFCEQAGCDRVLDLCSGSGEPVAILLEALEQRRLPAPRFALSDLYPHRERMQRVARRHPDRVEVVAEPVDATDVPAHLDRGARTIISAFHHFAPPLAAAILADCVRKRQAVFVLEPCPRDLRRVLWLSAVYTIAVTLNPLLAPRAKLRKATLTFGVPVLPAAGIWDGVVSIMRMYSAADIERLTSPLGDRFSWHYQQISVPLGGRISLLSGLPR